MHLSRSTAFLAGLLVALLAWPVQAQEVDTSKLAGIEPRSIGPAGMSGRVTAIDVSPTDDDVWYVGSGSGGLWKTTNGGTTFAPIFDDQPATSIGDVTVHPNNPDVIWVGTGEGNPRNSATGGNGVYKSVDGGKTWTHLGLEETRSVHRLLVHPEEPEVAYAGAQGATWGYNEERGVYKTTDGGETWEKILYVNEKTGVADMVMDPENPNKLFVAMWEYRRWPWFFESGGPGSGLYVTHDGGEDWTELDQDDGLPADTLGRMGLAIAPSNPDRVYAYVEKDDNALFRSDDGGDNWREINDSKAIGDRPFYYADLRVDPTNPDRVYSLHSTITYSIDGGKSFETLASYSRIHPDHHAMWIDPEDPSFIIEGNDGGLAVSHDYGETWRVPGNLPLAQYYHINVDNAFPYRIYGGMQDNGSWRGPNRVYRSGGVRNAYWEKVGFGDGFDVVPDPENPRYGYSMWQGGNLMRYDAETGGFEYSRPQPDSVIDPTEKQLRFNWNAAIAQSPHDPNTVYYGSQHVHKSTDEGGSWTAISPDLTTDRAAWQRQQESGGLTYDVTGAENFTTIVDIAPSPVQEGIIWAGTDDGQLHVTRNGGETWTNVVDNIEGVPEHTWIHQVKASKFNAGEAYVVFDNHRRADWTPYVYHTTNYGEDWTRIVGPEDVDGYALSLVQDPVAEDLLFLGTQLGLYFSLDGGDTWTPWTHGYPTAQTRDLAIQERERDLVIGTFGRAAYVLDDIQPLRALAQQGTSLLRDSVHAFQAPTAYLAEQGTHIGAHTGGQAVFEGENEPDGAMLTYSVARPDTSEVQNPPEEATIHVTNAEGDTIRTVTGPAKDGLNRTTWGLRRTGVRDPGTTEQEAQRRDRSPAGPTVTPGPYTAYISYRGHTDSTMVQVRPDPRTDGLTPDEREARQAMYDRLMARVETATEAADRLRGAQKTIEQVNAQLEGREDSTAVRATKKGRAMADSVDALLHRILPKEYEGIVDDPTLVDARLGQVGFYLGTEDEAPSETERIALERAEQRLRIALDHINAFFEDDWPAYKQAVERADPRFFDEYAPISMDEASDE
jgi:photosystem II stability/assembly factor-like uncharacterized protein